MRHVPYTLLCISLIYTISLVTMQESLLDDILELHKLLTDINTHLDLSKPPEILPLVPLSTRTGHRPLPQPHRSLPQPLFIQAPKSTGMDLK